MRKRKRIWTLLYRKQVWIYEPLRKKEVERMQKHGWRVVR